MSAFQKTVLALMGIMCAAVLVAAVAIVFSLREPQASTGAAQPVNTPIPTATRPATWTPTAQPVIKPTRKPTARPVPTSTSRIDSECAAISDWARQTQPILDKHTRLVNEFLSQDPNNINTTRLRAMASEEYALYVSQSGIKVTGATSKLNNEFAEAFRLYSESWSEAAAMDSGNQSRLSAAYLKADLAVSAWKIAGEDLQAAAGRCGFQ